MPSQSHVCVSSTETITTSFLISNLHCPSCVTTIKEALQALYNNHIKWVSPNIVTSVVTVQHDAVASVREMESAFEHAGFDVSGFATAGDSGQHVEATASPLPGPSPRWMTPTATGKSPAWRDSQTKTHLQNCEKCRTSTHLGPDQKNSIVAELTRLPSSPVDTAGHIERSDKLAQQSTRTQVGGRWMATLAIGGMTCAVCVNAITHELTARGWVSKAVVSLVTNSATVEFSDEDRVGEVVEAIENLGYEATVDTLVNMDENMQATKERTVEILVEGVYCEHCPERVIRSLDGFRRQLKVIRPPTDQSPVMKLSYVPEAPTFTVRQILAAIEASDVALTASIFHPPTMEERSRQILRHHQHQLLYRLALTGIISIPTFVIGIVYMNLIPGNNDQKRYLMEPWVSGISRAQIATFILATPVYFLGADLFHTRAVKEMRVLWQHGSRTPILQRFYRFGSMNTLISAGTTIAYVSSVAQLIAAGVIRPRKVDNSNFYFDSVVFLTFFLLIGRLIESFSKARASDAVEKLGKLRPTTAILVGSGVEKGQDSVVPADFLDSGDVIRVPRGASPAVDGVVVQGEGGFDESSLTGESRPVKKRCGSDVYSGTVNVDVPVTVKVTSVVGKSMLDQIVDIVRECQAKPAPMARIADVMTSYFVPAITLIAILTWIIWMSLGLSGRIPADWLHVNSGGWVAWSLQFATAVFIVACPCGLALAAPTAIFVGSGLAAKHGILVRGGGEAFEKASKVDCVVFDKTGTLTVGGEPCMTDFHLYSTNDHAGEARQESILAALRAVEQSSSHPVAKAIVTFCASKTSSPTNISNLEEIPGKGMKATENGSVPETSFDLIIGNEALMTDYAVPVPEAVAAFLHKWKTEAKSIALAATKPIGNCEGANAPLYTLAAVFAVSDPIRPDASAVIRALHNYGTTVWLLSGDNSITAASVASQLDIKPSNVISGVLPTQKAEKIKYLQGILKARLSSTTESSSQRATIAMVGDGINDSPALTAADVGIAIGTGSDVAISSADFVLLNSDLQSVINLLDMSRMVFRRIKFNFGWAIVYNCIAIPVAAGCFYPIVSNNSHIRLDPVWASLAMALSSISVVTSSLALRTSLPGIGFRTRKVE